MCIYHFYNMSIYWKWGGGVVYKLLQDTSVRKAELSSMLLSLFI